MPSFFYSEGAGKAYTRQGSIVVQDADGNDVLIVGKLVDDADEYGMSALDTDGNELVRVGALDDDLGYGVEILGEDEVQTFLASNQAGLLRPRVPSINYQPGDVNSTASGSFTSLWRCWIPLMLSRGLQVYVPWTTDPGTSGQVRVVSNLPSTSSTVALAAGSGDVYGLLWLPGTDDEFFGAINATFDVEARVSGGGGSVYLTPCAAWVRDPSLCTEAGAWFAL